MANFPTHIGIGTLACGMLATLTLAADVVAPQNLVGVTVAGILGSVLPDIDLKDSRPAKAMFFGLAVFFSFITLFLGAGHYSIVELWILAAFTFVMVNWVAHYVFNRFSYHRGVFHSVLAAVFFAFLTVIIYRYMLGRPEGVAWLAGAFMFIGYHVHLLLDEIYSVDVMDTRIKSSFGTALKFWDGKHLGHSGFMAACTVGLFLLTPPAKTFTEGVGSPQLWAGLKSQFLPHDKWFGVIRANPAFARLPWQKKAETTSPAATPATSATPAANVATPVTETPPASATSPVTTGTLPEQPKQ
ncbi:MAG: metal-dependent hydrolase [Proteobacteria bacterium]|nr:metal-dependent hydrolase [Pseudomonadota bacterium]